MIKKILNKKIDINAEMFGKASFFTDFNVFRGSYLKDIAITPTTALTEGVNIIATNSCHIVIFNDTQSSSCISKVVRGGKKVAINCVYKENGRLTEFIKDCRNSRVIKENIKARRKLTITFLRGDKCKVRFNKKSHVFDYNYLFPEIEQVFSREHFKNSSVAHSFSAQFLNKLKHLDLLCHKKIMHDNNIVFSVSKKGLLIAAKKGVIFACMPCLRDFDCNIENFVKGSLVDSYKDLDIFNKAIKKKEFETEFGSLLANELLNRSLV